MKLYIKEKHFIPGLKEARQYYKDNPNANITVSYPDKDMARVDVDGLLFSYCASDIIFNITD